MEVHLVVLWLVVMSSIKYMYVALDHHMNEIYDTGTKTVDII